MRTWSSRSLGLAFAICCAMGAAQAQGDDLVSLDIKDAPLGDAIKMLSAETNIQFILGADVDASRRITVSFSDRPVERALELLLTSAGNLKFEKAEGIYIITPADGGKPAGPAQPRPGTATTPPRPVPGRPTQPAGTAPRPGGAAGGATAAGTDAGSPTVTSKRYEKIQLVFAYAPGLAAALGGQALMYSMIDPWAGMVSGGGGGGFGGGSGGFGGGSSFGGGGFGGGGFGGGGSSFGGGGFGGGGSSFGGGGFGGGGGGFGGGGGGFGF